MAEELNLLLQPDRFEKFKTQTRKDFELAGASHHLPYLETTTLTELENEFYNSVLKLDAANNLSNVLYRIDITETQIQEAVRKFPGESFQKLLAQLMIKRILQKVVLKDFYSN